MKSFKLKPVVRAVAETLHRVTLGYMEWLGALRYVAHTAVESFTDTIYSISASLPATYDASGYAATTITWTVVGKVKTFPEFGSERQVQEWTPIAGPVEKSKSAPNYGGGAMVLGDVPADAGQVILKAAELSPNHYSMKALFPDGEIAYFDVLVCSWRASSASSGAFFERNAMIQFCRKEVVVAAT